MVVIKFESLKNVQDWYNPAAYSWISAKDLRLSHTTKF